MRKLCIVLAMASCMVACSKSEGVESDLVLSDDVVEHFLAGSEIISRKYTADQIADCHLVVEGYMRKNDVFSKKTVWPDGKTATMGQTAALVWMLGYRAETGESLSAADLQAKSQLFHQFSGGKEVVTKAEFFSIHKQCLSTFESASLAVKGTG